MVENSNKPAIGIIGVGMVGEQIKRYFEQVGYTQGENLLCFDTDQSKGCSDDVSQADVVFICVPTPTSSDGSCDTSIVESVVKERAGASSKDTLFVIKSTVPPGTTESLAHTYNVPILFNPEFLTEAKAWEDMLHPDRQIVGPTTEATREHALKILALLPQADFSSPSEDTAITATEAEFGKYAANTFGALKVTFGNIIYDFCRVFEQTLDEGRVDYDAVKDILAHDVRIGPSWLEVDHGQYRGYGGYCFPKDTNALMIHMQKALLQLPAGDTNKDVTEKGLTVLEAMREYNQALLKSQGLSEKLVSRHDAELEKKLKERS